MSGRLPPEVFDSIIDQVWQASTTSDLSWSDVELMASDLELFRRLSYTCALVCRAWVPRSRHLQFHTLQIGWCYPKPATFGEVMSHPCCTIRQHVRSLELSGDRKHFATGFEAAWPYLHLLPNIDTVDITFVTFDESAADWNEFVLPGLFRPTLKSLRIESCTFLHEEHILQCVSRCSNLVSVSVSISPFYLLLSDAGADASHSGALSVDTRGPTRLRSLSFSHLGLITNPLMEWLCSVSNTLRVLEVADMEFVQEAGALPVSRFLRLVGASLTILSLSFSDSSFGETDAQDAFCNAADFSTMINLRRINFARITIYPDYFGRHLSAKHVPLLLAKVVSDELRDITFQLNMNEADDLLMINWDDVLPTLNRASLRRLGRLYIHGVKEELLEETEQWLAERVGNRLRREIEIVCRSEFFRFRTSA